MNPTETQGQITGDPKASLGFSNMLREQMFNNQHAQAQPAVDTSVSDTGATPADESGATQPINKEDVQNEISGLETRLMDELKTLREEMKTQGDGKKELADLKKQIESILNSNE